MLLEVLRVQGHLDTNTLDMTNNEHRHLVLQIALKCADISNPCRPWDISRKWSMKVCEEFFRQGDYERRLNLPVTALCDRHNTSIPKIQTGFFQFVVTPLITEWDRFLRNDLSAQMLENLLYNKKKWEVLLEKELEVEIKTELPDHDLVIGIDEDESESYSETNSSDSSDLLLPPRRRPLAGKSAGLRGDLRNFSVPVTVNQNTISRDNSMSPSEYRSRAEHALMETELSEHPQLCVSGHIERSTASNVLSKEKLLSEPTIASIKAPIQKTRLNIVMTNRAYWKLVRQQTFPPQAPTARDQSLDRRPLYTSDENTLYHHHARTDLPDSVTKDKLDSLIKESKKDITDIDKNDPKVIDMKLYSDQLETEKSNAEELQSAAVIPINTEELSCQVQDVACAVPDSSDLEHNQRRRKSMPTDTLLYGPKEKKMREMTLALPQLLCRTISGKEGWSRRRGSAPAPVAPSELRGLAALGVIRHSVNGGRRKPNQISTCQQWLQKTTYSVQERAMHLPRRSSLPVEVMAGA
ncbi:hypothetical protein O3G_MSEX005893 [Manduca sexta]|uniref:PDEase domain-containing protein n=1 Tax=Manduca sexta TaxID=7130 RepID=A0A922CK65_MANSE|nr:hypothetical protein O3G_MSEX005893 [Manduca sexta]